MMALVLFGPAGRKELMVTTGWKKEAVSDALGVLEYYDLVFRLNYRKWSLTDGWTQLGLFESPGNSLSGSCPQVVDNAFESPENSLSDAERPGNSPSALDSSSRSITTKTKSLLPTPDPVILAVCDECGIYGKKRESLASMRHVVEAGPDYVRDHVALVDTSLAIWRMEEGWSVPGKKKRVAVPPEYEDIVKR
jgi:hypothetical protein